MTSKAEELIAQLEAEIVKRDARIAGLVGVRDHLRLQASIQAQEARTQKAIVAEIGAMVGEPCDWLTASAVREALKAQQPSSVVDERAAFDAAWPSISENLPSHQREPYSVQDVERAEHDAAREGWQARARLSPATAGAGVVLPDSIVDALKFYADGDHLLLADPDAWDTCSGEPMNFLHDDAGTASVEDGSIAKAALARLNPCRAQAVPDGWVMVPVEPTGEMEQFICNCDVRNGAITGDYPEWQQCYKAMLAAAPPASADAVSVPREMAARLCSTDNHVRQTARRELRSMLAAQGVKP